MEQYTRSNQCCDCQASYIGETDRNLSTRLTEHKRATRNGDVNNHIAAHHLQTKHHLKLTGTFDMYNSGCVRCDFGDV